jgi:nicotinate dehydrogenase subunit A
MEAPITLRVNGADRTIDGDGLLIDALRDTLGLKGTRYGCGAERCGACLVLLDGNPSFACALPAHAAANRSVTTIEGLGTPEAPHPLQRAFIAEQAAQCGYCTSGMIVRAAALLAQTPHPSESQVREALEGNLCRCTGYHNIVKSIVAGAKAMGGKL